jgi:hypothetical protein
MAAYARERAMQDAHGGTNPGAPKGNRNARKLGGYSAKPKAALAFLKEIAKFVRICDL